MAYQYQGAGWRGERVPSGGATAGARAIQAQWARLGGQSDGIYNPRPIRGSKTTWSVHAVGRAFDARCDARSERAKGDAYAAYLIQNWERLGVQYLIWNHRSWRPDRGWRQYTGVDPHTGHLHIELGIDAARQASVGWAETPDLGHPAPAPKPKPPAPKPVEEDMAKIVKVKESGSLWVMDGVSRRTVTTKDAGLLAIAGLAQLDKGGVPFVLPRSAVELVPEAK